MDEPTSALDRDSENVFVEMVESLRRNVTIIIASHSANVTKLGDFIYQVEGGNIKLIEDEK